MSYKTSEVPIAMKNVKLDAYGVPMLSKEDIAKGFSLNIERRADDELGFAYKDKKLIVECHLYDRFGENDIYNTFELSNSELVLLKIMLNSMDLGE